MGEDSELVTNGCSLTKSTDGGVLSALLAIPTLQKVADAVRTSHDAGCRWSHTYDVASGFVSNGLLKISNRLLEVDELKTAIAFLDQKSTIGVEKLHSNYPIIFEDPVEIYTGAATKLIRRLNHLKAYVASYALSQKTLNVADRLLAVVENNVRCLPHGNPVARRVANARRGLRVVRRAGRRMKKIDVHHRYNLKHIGQRKKIKASPRKKREESAGSFVSVLLPRFLLNMASERDPTSPTSKRERCSEDGGPMSASKSDGETEGKKRTHSEMNEDDRTLLEKILDDMEDYMSDVDSDYQPSEFSDTDSMEYRSSVGDSDEEKQEQPAQEQEEQKEVHDDQHQEQRHEEHEHNHW